MSAKEPQLVKGQVGNQSDTRTAARRKILRTLVAGGGAVTAARITSEDWVRPVVESVVLPSHAQTSAAGATGPGGNFASGPVMVGVQPDSDTLLAEQPLSDELLEFFMPSASAQGIPCINASCDVSFGLQIAPDASRGFVCVSGDSTGSAGLIGVSGTGFSSSDNQFGTYGEYFADGGTFVNGRWSMNVINTYTNISTMVTLSSGGAGCVSM